MEIKNDIFITIKKTDYDELVEDSNFLSCLEAAGVDSWDWYDFAVEEYNNTYKKTNDKKIPSNS